MAPYSLFLALLSPLLAGALTVTRATIAGRAVSLSSHATTAVAMPTKERTGTKYDVGSQRRPADRSEVGSRFEWAIDPDASRADKDDFHILLLNETFAKPRMTVARGAARNQLGRKSDRP